MARKKRKRVKHSRFLAGIQSVTGLMGRAILRLVPVVALGALIFIGFSKVRELLYADPALGIREIKVIPENILPASLKADLEKKWVGKNIFMADVKAVSRFLAKDPIVLRAETVKVFPSTLLIHLSQRTPFARIRFVRDGEAAIISEDGVILGVEKTWDSPFEGPSFEAFETRWKKPVQGVPMPPKGFTRAVEFYRQFKQHPLSSHETLTRMSLDYLGNLTVTLGTGPDVKVGRHPVDMLKSLQKLNPFLDPAERSRIQYVDLQFEDVIVKKKGK